MLVLAALVVSCKNANSYSNDLKKEKELINDYINRNHIKIIYEEPAYGEWKDDEYLELGDYCYFHLSKPGERMTISEAGDTVYADSIASGDRVIVRYRQYTLNVHPDTISYWTSNDSPYPIEFQYGVSTDLSCTAWHYALRCMKFSGAEGKLICPSKLGFDEASETVTPYGYDLKFRILRY